VGQNWRQRIQEALDVVTLLLVILRQVGGEGNWRGVDITQGRLDLEGCDISSQGGACVAIRNGADPRLRRNQIRDGKSCGVYVQDNGLGTLEDNDIAGSALTGVEITTGGSPTLRGNRVNRSGYEAVYVHSGGKGVLEDNDLTGNSHGAWDIASGSKANVRRARNKE